MLEKLVQASLVNFIHRGSKRKRMTTKPLTLGRINCFLLFDSKSIKFPEMERKFVSILTFPSKAWMRLRAFNNTCSLHVLTSVPMILSLVVNMCTRNYFGTSSIAPTKRQLLSAVKKSFQSTPL